MAGCGTGWLALACFAAGVRGAAPRCSSFPWARAQGLNAFFLPHVNAFKARCWSGGLIAANKLDELGLGSGPSLLERQRHQRQRSSTKFVLRHAGQATAVEHLQKVGNCEMSWVASGATSKGAKAALSCFSDTRIPKRSEARLNCG